MLLRSIITPVSSNSPQKRIGFQPALWSGLFFARRNQRAALTFTTAIFSMPTDTCDW